MAIRRSNQILQTLFLHGYIMLWQNEPVSIIDIPKCRKLERKEEEEEEEKEEENEEEEEEEEILDVYIHGIS